MPRADSLTLIDIQPGPADAEQQPAQARSRRELRERTLAEASARGLPGGRRVSLRRPVDDDAHTPPSLEAISAPRAAAAAELALRPRARVKKAVERHGGRRSEHHSHRSAGRGHSVVARSTKPRLLKRVLLSKLMTVGAMFGVGAMLVATSLPANAFYDPDVVASASAIGTVEQAQVQSLRIDTAAASPVVSRDAYTVSSLAEKLRIKYPDRGYSYTNNPNGSIQWPFAIPVPISSTFGSRVSPCSGCSSYHEGVDFTPGSGAAIQAIADGVVSAVSLEGAYGNHVMIDHVINGVKVQSLYAHMQYGSIRVAVGQAVTVGTEVGQVGSTGASTGAHLHLEIHVNGTPVDPFAWLKAHAN